MSDTEKDIERGEKRGVLSTGRANKLGKTTEDADADAANDDADEEEDDAGG